MQALRSGFGAVAMACLAACSPTSEQSAGQAAPDHPDFTGVWSGSITTQDNPAWGVADFVCFPGCPKSFHDTLTAALADPANADAPPDALIGAALGAMAVEREAIATPEGLARIAENTSFENIDVASYCEPYGFMRETMNALPMVISEQDGDLVFTYEEFSLSRTIYMDGRSPPDGLEPAPLGWSTGRYEGDALVIDTVAIAGDRLTGFVSQTVYWGSFADGASAQERYTISDGRLTVVVTLTDPVTLTRPYEWTKAWLSTPDVELVEDSCVDVPGQMSEGSAP